tara:strand:+ start:322 stop:753 length:432 start_codon:yes stop_codon:yes gene_type:complete
MGTRSNIAYERSNGQVVVTYCHYDGYPEYNGVILNENYNTPQKAEELANQGYFVGLKPNLKDSLERGGTSKEAPMIYHSLHSYLNDIQWDIEWIYIFKRGQWYVCEGMEVDDNFKILDKDFIENDFKPLVDVLTNIHLQEESA